MLSNMGFRLFLETVAGKLHHFSRAYFLFKSPASHCLRTCTQSQSPTYFKARDTLDLLLRGRLSVGLVTVSIKVLFIATLKAYSKVIIR